MSDSSHPRWPFFMSYYCYFSAVIIIMSAKDTSKPVQAVDLPSRPSWDRERDEPFLPLPSFPALRLTPFRDGDDDAIVSHRSLRTARISITDIKGQAAEGFRCGEICVRLSSRVRPSTARVLGKMSAHKCSYEPEHNARIWKTHHPQCLASISIIRPLILSLDTHEKLGMTHLRNPMPVIRDHTSGQLIGRVMSKPHSTDHVSGKVTWEFGFSLMPGYRGKGVAKEV